MIKWIALAAVGFIWGFVCAAAGVPSWITFLAAFVVGFIWSDLWDIMTGG